MFRHPTLSENMLTSTGTTTATAVPKRNCLEPDGSIMCMTKPTDWYSPRMPNNGESNGLSTSTMPWDGWCSPDTNNAYPSVTNADVRIINFYDDYLWLNYFNDVGTPDLTGLTFAAKSGFGAQHSSAKGFLTGNYTKLLDASARSVTTNYYDLKGQLTQNCLINMKGGYDRTFFNYNFDGSVDKKQTEQTGMAPQPNVTELYKYDYDSQGRLKATDYTLNNGSTVALSRLNYNELGQLAGKVTAGLETTSYNYNIRSWIEKIAGNRFTEELLYTNNIHYGDPLYFNGNISNIRWIAPDKPGQYRGYAFGYDQIGRLTYSGYGEGINLDSNNDKYSEYFSYDKHGNSSYIIRRGRLDNGTFGAVDNIEYQIYNGNKVTRIHDWAGDQNNSDLMEFKNGITGNIEYTYDTNGNMTSDLNKKISLIQYNELNLPKRIEFQNGSWITYAYDASGVKHKTTHYMMSGGMGNTTTTEYVGNKIFKNGQLDRILTEEGYVAKNGSQYNPYYFLRDHLGSNRVVMNASGNVVQVTNYYPSGASLAESPAQSDQGTQPYKYNGKELDREGGWDAYDYGARMYDPAMGRFMTMDPLAEDNFSVSPYAYVDNNPVRWIDPTGMKKGDPNDPIELPEVVVTPKPVEIGDQVLPKESFLWEFWYLFAGSRQYVDKTSYNGIYQKTFNVGANGKACSVVNPYLIQGKAPTPSTSPTNLKDIVKLLKVAKMPSKGNLSAVGRALKKHSDRGGSVFPKAVGTPAAVNAQGEAVLESILKNPAATVTKTTSRSVGNVLDYKIPGGMGARFSLDGEKFIGFLEP